MSPTAPISKLAALRNASDKRVCVTYAECKACKHGARFGVLTIKGGFICEKCYGTESKDK